MRRLGSFEKKVWHKIQTEIFSPKYELLLGTPVAEAPEYEHRNIWKHLLIAHWFKSSG